MKVLVTGAAGLIGIHLCDKLLDIGCEVVGVDNFSFGNIKNLPKTTIGWQTSCQALYLSLYSLSLSLKERES